VIRRALVFTLLAALPPGPRLTAQTPGQPRLYLTAFAGYRAGQAFWSLNHQPVAILTASGDSALVGGSGQRDTLNLARDISPSFVVGASGTYFPHSHLGFQAELAFLGMGIESRCTIRQAQPLDPTDVNPLLCSSLDAQAIATSAVSVSVSLVGRLTPGKEAFPYVKAGAGIMARTRSTVEMVGSFLNGSEVAAHTVVGDRSPANTSMHFSFGAGIAATVGRAYQVWFEGRDIVAQLDRPSGLADPSSPSGTLYPPHGRQFFHNFVFAIGLDVVFEKQRGRRY
jgi:hypothetical protein